MNASRNGFIWEFLIFRVYRSYKSQGAFDVRKGNEWYSGKRWSSSSPQEVILDDGKVIETNISSDDLYERKMFADEDANSEESSRIDSTIRNSDTAEANNDNVKEEMDEDVMEMYDPNDWNFWMI